MMKLTLSILLVYSLCMTSAFTGGSPSIIRNPFDNSIGNRYGSHGQRGTVTSTRTRTSYAITPESPEYQDSIKGNFTTAMITKKSSSNNFEFINVTSVLTGINVLQACTAALCVVGRLPVLNKVMSFMVGKGLLLIGIAIMGLAWNETRNKEDNNNNKSLITSGPLYSQVRHPFLAGQWMALIGFAGYFGSDGSSINRSPIRYLLAGLYYLVLRKRVEMEEQELEEQFGHDYQVYKVLVKGQLIPHAISSKFHTE
mmetsp:Transcript_7854/g.18925  ORF Transcript_7854/g.18925 Transcript_7854/m.18925 type:complete len:255 (-) Transcript_7854:297-1061(-)